MSIKKVFDIDDTLSLLIPPLFNAPQKIPPLKYQIYARSN